MPEPSPRPYKRRLAGEACSGVLSPTPDPPSPPPHTHISAACVCGGLERVGCPCTALEDGAWQWVSEVDAGEAACARRRRRRRGWGGGV
eukprot:6203493-Pleurochrysis_carterae.AAC.1